MDGQYSYEMEQLLAAYRAMDWCAILARNPAEETLPCSEESAYRAAVVSAALIRSQGLVGSRWEVQARALARELGQDEPVWIVEVEWAAWLMGLGHFAAAVDKLRGAPVARLGLYVASRVLTVRFVSMIYLGKLAGARSLLRQLQAVLEPQEHGRILLARCQLIFFLETEELGRARRVVEELPLFRPVRDGREYNLQIEQIRYYFFLGENDLAAKLLTLSAQYSPAPIADVHGERKLREGATAQCHAYLQAMLEQCETVGSAVGVCDTLLLLARWHLHNRTHGEAETLLVRLDALATRCGYPKVSCRCHVLRGLLLAARNERVTAAQELRAAGHIAQRCGFPTLAAISQTFLLALEGWTEQAGWSPELTRLMGRRTRFEYETLRALFPDSLFQGLSVRSLSESAGVKTLSVLQICDRLLEVSPACVWRPHTGELLVRERESLLVHNLRRTDVLRRALQFVAAPTRRKFSLEALSREVWNTQEYREERHGARGRALLVRLRELLDGVAEVEFDAVARAYQLKPRGEFLVVQHHSSARQGVMARREAICRVLECQGPVRVEYLCRELDLTRQALHRYLKALGDEGKILKQGEGRATTYALNPGNPSQRSTRPQLG